MTEVSITQKLRLRFEPYKKYNFLFFISEINIRNTMLPFFAALGVKKLAFMKNKEELIYEVAEKAREEKRSRYAICIMTYHHENVGNPAYIGSLQPPSFSDLRSRIGDDPMTGVDVRFSPNYVRSTSNNRHSRHGLRLPQMTRCGPQYPDLASRLSGLSGSLRSRRFVTLGSVRVAARQLLIDNRSTISRTATPYPGRPALRRPSLRRSSSASVRVRRST